MRLRPAREGAMNLLLLGPPGAGKGTQAALLVAERGMVQLSTGDMLRAAKDGTTPLAERIRAVMASGQLVSDAVVSALIGEHLDRLNAGAGAIFDGYPRTAAQADALDLLLEERGRALDLVIELEVDENVLVERVVGRYTCARCGTGYHDRFKTPAKLGVCDVCGSTEFKRRPDDNEATVRTRMAVYRGETAPILPIYEARGIVRRVDGMAAIDEVSRAIGAMLASGAAD